MPSFSTILPSSCSILRLTTVLIPRRFSNSKPLAVGWPPRNKPSASIRNRGMLPLDGISPCGAPNNITGTNKTNKRRVMEAGLHLPLSVTGEGYDFSTEMDAKRKTPLAAVLSIFAPVHQEEALTAFLLMMDLFLLLTAYYIIKPVREAL